MYAERMVEEKQMYIFKQMAPQLYMSPKSIRTNWDPSHKHVIREQTAAAPQFSALLHTQNSKFTGYGADIFEGV